MDVIDAEGWTENRPTRGNPRLQLREIWEYRELAVFLGVRDIKVRYKQAVFGAAWAVVQPLAAVAAYTVVFDRLAKVPSEGLAYPVFAYVGAVAWAYLSSTVLDATQSLVSNAALVRKIYFPRIFIPLAAGVPGLVDAAVGGCVLAAMLVIFGISPGWQILALPLCVAALVAVAVGTGLLLGALNVRYRDVKHATALLLQVWLFVSPVAYPSSLVSGGWRHLYSLNPMTGIIDSMRWSLLGVPWPGVELAISAASAAVLVVVGVTWFRRSERSFADII